MKKFTNPLDNIKIASPCPADWNKMYGDERKRYCSECKLNVYNLSDMTRTEAEKFLINSEGRTCVKFHRRKDGTVLTKDCPVGWQKLKKRVSRIGTALFASFVGLFAGVFAFDQLQLEPLNLENEVKVDFEVKILEQDVPIAGEVENLQNMKEQIMGRPLVYTKENKNIDINFEALKQRAQVRRLEDEPVVAWIK